MNIFKFRVIIDTEEDIFRDIEISTQDNFEALHKAILKAFDWEQGEMASFYMSNDTWDRGEEIPLMDMNMGGEAGGGGSMKEIKLNEVVQKPNEKLIYVYDFLRMWCFYLELQSVKKAAPSVLYPILALAYGDSPEIDSKEMDLFDDLYVDEEPSKSKPAKTGDPELDQYLEEQDEGFDDGMESLDDLDDERF
jgi:hypothetical protein